MADELILVKRTRRAYSATFKAEIVAASQQPGVSVAGVALANGLNANMLRRWIREHVDGANPSTDRPAILRGSSFVPVPMNDSPAQTGQLQLQGKTVWDVSRPQTNEAFSTNRCDSGHGQPR